MGYVAATAGEEVIERAEQLFETQSASGASVELGIDKLEDQL